MKPVTIFEITRFEAVHLAELVEQFTDLVDEPDDTDPAVRRLTPDVYPDDSEASAEFRSLSRDGLLGRRARDARAVVEEIRTSLGAGEDDDEDSTVDLRLDSDDLDAWMRTLAAIRLVLASRLGIVDEDDRDPDDPRFGVYDWIGFRLEGLVQAADAAGQGSSYT